MSDAYIARNTYFKETNQETFKRAQ